MQRQAIYVDSYGLHSGLENRRLHVMYTPVLMSPCVNGKDLQCHCILISMLTACKWGRHIGGP